MRNEDVTKTGGQPFDAAWLRTIDYPATRHDLLVNVRSEAPDMLELFQQLPQRTYSGTRDVMLELRALTESVAGGFAS